MNMEILNKNDFYSKKRRLHLLHSGYMSDCAFLVGEDNEPSHENYDCWIDGIVSEEIIEKKLFRCHKMVLATASEVFERMFYGGFTDNPSPIHIFDISPANFEVFVKYVYTYDIDPEHVTIQNLPELVYIGDKYMMQDFTDVCIDLYRRKPCNMKDAFPIFELGCLYDNEALLMISYKKFDKYGLKLFEDPSFFNLNINYIQPLMVYLTRRAIIHPNKLLIALEQYEKKNNANGGRNSEIFLKLVDAACCLDFQNMDANEYSRGPAYSHLFA